MNRVAGKVALITGAASGLGRAIALLLAEEGAAVAVTDVSDDAGQALVDEISSNGGRAIYHNLDVSSEASWRAALDATEAHFGKLNILVNNAGIAPPGDASMDFELWRKTQSINLDGVFLGCKYGIETMSRCGEKGSIINVSSVMAMVGQATTVAYSASKGGVRSLTKAVAMDCAARSLPIRVNSVHPGTCVTPLVQAYYDSQAPEVLQAQIDRHPIGHLGDPMDVAYAVLYLASDESKFVLGSELVVDGGMLASG